MTFPAAGPHRHPPTARGNPFCIRATVCAMANQAVLTITVKAARGSCSIGVSTNGRYVSLPVNTIAYVLQGQPLQPSASAEVFWGSVLAAVSGSIAAH